MMCGPRFKERCPHIAKVNNQPRSEIIGARTTRGEEMKVKELIKHLQSLGKKRQNYSVRVIEEEDNGDPNYWIDDIEVSDKGDSGYLHGEIRLIGSE